MAQKPQTSDNLHDHNSESENNSQHQDQDQGAKTAPQQALPAAEGGGNRFFLSRFEYLFLLVLFLVCVIAGALSSGGPVFHDEIRYMEMAMHPSFIETYAPQFLRLFHIYYLKLFLLVAGPLQAGRLFWAVTVGAIAVLVYFNARIMSRETTYVHGFLAVYLFFSTTVVFNWSGAPLADLTLSMMVTLGITCYLLAFRLHRYRFVPLIGLGITLFLALQSKQTGIGLVVLLPGLGWLPGESFQWRRLAVHTGLVLAGCVAGVVALAILNALFVGNALFRIDQRLQEFWFIFQRIFVGGSLLSGIGISVLSSPGSGILSSVSSIHMDLTPILPFQGDDTRFLPLLQQAREFSGTWYTSIARQGQWMVVFALYLLAVVKDPHQRFQTGQRFLWLLPLFLIILIRLAASYVPFAGDRHYMVLFPVMSILAAQCLTLEPRDLEGDHLKVIGGIVLTFFASILLLPDLTFTFGWGFHNLIYRLVYPLGLAIIFAASIGIWKRTYTLNLLIVAVVVCISSPSLVSIPKLMAQSRERSEAIVYPYTRFAEDIDYRDDMRFFFSKTIMEEQPTLSFDANIARGLFEIAFNQKLPGMSGQFYASDSLDAITEREYTYILLSIADWEALPADERQQLARRYTVRFDQQDESDSTLVFLEHTSS
jgi:hypothetical protein